MEFSKSSVFKGNTADGTGTDQEAADFTGIFTAPIVLEVDPGNNKTVYIADGNTVYKYTNSNWP